MSQRQEHLDSIIESLSTAHMHDNSDVLRLPGLKPTPSAALSIGRRLGEQQGVQPLHLNTTNYPSHVHFSDLMQLKSPMSGNTTVQLKVPGVF